MALQSLGRNEFHINNNFTWFIIMNWNYMFLPYSWPHSTPFSPFLLLSLCLPIASNTNKYVTLVVYRHVQGNNYIPHFRNWVLFSRWTNEPNQLNRMSKILCDLKLRNTEPARTCGSRRRTVELVQYTWATIYLLPTM